MKNLLKFSILAAFAMLFAACQEQIAPEVSQIETKTITVTVDETATRTTLNADRTGLAWEVGDKFGYFSNGTDAAANTAVEYTEGATTYTLTVPADATEIYAYYPYFSKTDGTANTSATSVNLGIGTQIQEKGGAFDGYNYPMVAKATIEGDNAVLKFQPIVSAVAFNIYNTSADYAGGETVKSVTLITPNVSGRAAYDLTTGKFTGTPSYSDSKVTLTTPVTVANVKPEDAKVYADQIYLMVHKSDYTNATLKVETSANTYTFKNVNLNCTDSDIISMNLNLSKGSVPAIVNITDGDYILAYNDGEKYYAMTTDEGGYSDRRAAVEIAYAGTNSYVADNANMIWTLNKVSDNTYTIMNSDSFLGYESKKAPLVSSAYEFTFETAEGQFEYVIYPQSNTYRLTLNTATNNGKIGGFGFYEGKTNTILVIPVAEDTREQLAKPQNFTAEVVEGTPNSVILTWDAVENATGYEVSYEGLAEPVAVTGLTHTFEGLEYEKDYSFSVVATGDATTYRTSEAGVTTATTGADPNAGEGGSNPQWILVADVSTLKAGDMVVIVAAGYDYALSTTQNKNNRSQAAVIKSDNTVSFENDVQVLILEAGESDDTWAFNTGSGYLYAAGGTGKNNFLKTSETLTSPGYWKISIDHCCPEKFLP